jgi:protein transport protein HofC
MVWLVYVAILCWALRQVVVSGEVVQRMSLGLLVSLGFLYLGYWMAMRLQRFSFFGWMVFVFAYIGMTASTTGLFCLPTIPVLIGAIIYLSYRRLADHQDALLGIMELAADRGMPMGPAILAYASQTRGNFQNWAETLGELLRRGIGLQEALDGIPGLVSRQSRLLIRMGSESGHLARGLHEAYRARSFRVSLAQKITSQVAYMTWVATMAFGITGFLMYFIIPKFEAIFKDFGVELPPVTMMMIRGSHVAVDYFWVPFLGGLGLCGFIAINLFNGGGWSLPFADRLFSRRHTLLILRSLSLFIEAERPIASAMYSLGEWYPTRWVRNRLRLVAADVSQGIDWIDSMNSTGLLKASDVGVLSSAQRAGNLSWAIHELVETGERRLSFRLHGFLQLGFIVSMLILGGMILFLAVGYFSPLTLLILRLSQ